jgi:hypothetical protein
LGLEFALSNSGSAAVLKLISASTQPLFSRQQKQAGKAPWRSQSKQQLGLQIASMTDSGIMFTAILVISESSNYKIS